MKTSNLKCAVRLVYYALIILLVIPNPTMAVFRASVVKVDITPSEPKNLQGYQTRKSIGVHDRIFHRIVVMDDGIVKFVLVSTEICQLSNSEYDEMSLVLEKELAISPLNFWWSTTHTHSAPEVGSPGLDEIFLGERYKHQPDYDYTKFVKDALLEGVKVAIGELTPCKLNVGWGFSQANINRRAIGSDGKASLGLNPDGPIDRRIGIIRIDDVNNKPLALIANYPVHGTVFGPDNLYISGDLPGVISAYVENEIGAPLLFINGAAGNLAPIYSVRHIVNKDIELDQFCLFLGDKIIEAYKKIPYGTNQVEFQTGDISIETPRKDGLDWPPDLSEYARTTNDSKQIIVIPARFLRINKEIAVWSLPVELFCEISNEIRERSPFPYTFYFGYTNGWLGYLPSADQFKYGGYEVDIECPYTPEAEIRIKEGVLAYLQGELLSGKGLP